MLDPVATWESTFNALPKVNDTSWAENFAEAVSSLTTGKLEISGIKTIPASFTFNKPIFKAQLLPLLPVDSPVLGANHFADAWATAMLSSTMSVSSGASVGLPATPGNTFASASCTIDPPTTAKAGLVAAITSIVPTTTANAFAKAFRDAFLALTCSTTGMNTVTPTPSPLADPLDPTA